MSTDSQTYEQTIVDILIHKTYARHSKEKKKGLELYTRVAVGKRKESEGRRRRKGKKGETRKGMNKNGKKITKMM